MGSIQNPLASIQGGKIGSWRNISKNSGVAKYISTQTYLHRRKDQNISPMLQYISTQIQLSLYSKVYINPDTTLSVF